MKPIAARDLVPHAGRMCLLDAVIGWQADWIHCRSCLPAIDDHPLAGPAGLGSAALIEYGAQATAAHGTLTARAAHGPATPMAGQVVALRDVRIATTRRELAGLATLDIHAERIAADGGASIYAFRVFDDAARVLVSGRVTIRTVAPG